jgi:hypothetical protein
MRVLSTSALNWQSDGMPSYRGYRFLPNIVGHAVGVYRRFSLSLRDVEDLLTERGISQKERCGWDAGSLLVRFEPVYQYSACFSNSCFC